MQCKVTHHICYGFLQILKNPKNSAKILNFWLILGSFVITSSCASAFTPHFLCQMKVLMEIYNRGKFHFYSVSGCPVIKFEMFSWGQSIHEMGHFGGFLGPNFPKYCPILLKFGLELLFKDSKTLLQKLFKNLDFQVYRTFPNFAHFFSFCPTLAPFFSMKEAEIEKSKYFFEGKTTSSGYPNIVKSRPYLVPIFQEKQITFCPILAVFH